MHARTSKALYTCSYNNILRSMRVIRARYPGTCVLCGQSWLPGELIAKSELNWAYGWAHAKCVEEEEA